MISQINILGWAPLIVVVFGCGSSAVAPPIDRDGGSAGLADAGSGSDPIVAAALPPVLTPCPAGWIETPAADGPTTCDPWPNSSPIQRPCPTGWSEQVDEGVRVCEPPWGDDATPVVWACPERWRPVEVAGFDLCDPFPESGPGQCNDDEMHTPGSAACERIGTACPAGAGAFPVGLPSGSNVVYVRAGAANGVGSEAAPFGSLAQVPFEQLAANTIVAVAKGTYTSAIELRNGVTLWGACAGETVLTSDVPHDERGVVAAFDVGNRVTNLRIADSARVGISAVGVGNSIRIDDVIVERTSGRGIYVAGAAVSIERALVRETQTATAVDLAAGLAVTLGADVTVARSTFADNAGSGVQILGSALGPRSTMNLEDLVVRGTLPVSSGASAGIAIGPEADVDARRLVIDDNADFGIWSSGPNTLDLDDSVISRTAYRENVAAGIYISGATANVRRVWLNANDTLGVLAVRNSRVVLEDLAIRNTLEPPDLESVYALEFGSGTTVDALRIGIDRTPTAGVRVQNAEATLEDLLIRDTLGVRSGALGRGIYLTNSASVSVRRALFQNLGSLGVSVDSDSRFAAEDLVIDTVRGAADGTLGYGVNVESGATARLAGLRIEAARAVGVATFGGTSTVLEDVVVRDTKRDSDMGGGVAIFAAGDLQFERGVIANNYVGVIAFGSTVTIADALIRDTTGAFPQGVAIFAEDGASLSVQRALIERFGVRALQVWDAPTSASITDVVVRGDDDNQDPAIRTGQAALEIRRLFVEHTDGFRLAGPATLEDVVLRRSLVVQAEDASLSVARIDIQDAAFGLFASGATLDVSDFRMRGTRIFGMHIFDSSGGLRRLDLAEVEGHALRVRGDSMVEVEDFAIDGVDPRVCTNPDCVSNAVGISSESGAAVTLTRGRIESSAGCGLWLLSEGEIDASELLVARNQIGACVQTDDFDLSRIDGETVTYRDNVETIVFTDLPVP